MKTAVLVSVVLAASRVFGATHPAFQAAAHLYVGGLVAADFRGWSWRPWRFVRMNWPSVYFKLAAGLSAVETACAVAGVGR